jgi:hypothetical protein
MQSSVPILFNTVATTNTNRFNDTFLKPFFLVSVACLPLVRRHLSSIVVLFFQAPASVRDVPNLKLNVFSEELRIILEKDGSTE